MTTGASRSVAAIIILIAIFGGFWYYSRHTGESRITSFEECKSAGYQIMESYPEQCRTPDGRTFVNDSQVIATTTPETPGTAPSPTTSGGTSGTTGNATKGEIRNVNVAINQLVTSPLTITGEAAGWYFEASFPVELVDANGKRLAAGPAQAQGDWMTSAFVPFKATLAFATPTTATGTLILRNDNPSGLKENERELRIPVRFTPATRTVSLYFYNPNLDKDAQGNVLCSTKGLVPVTRSIPVTQTPLQDSLRLLLAGNLTASERTSGITTEFPLSGVTLDSAAISSGGKATITVTDPLERTSGGACRVQVLKAQIEATARQFSNVTSVTILPTTAFQP